MSIKDMDIAKHFQNHPTFEFSTEINNICKPLKQCHIDSFIYSRLFPDKTRIVLSTNPVWDEHYLTNVFNLKYVDNYFFEEFIDKPHLVSLDIYPDNPAFKYAKKNFNFESGITIPFKCENYIELCYFATTLPDKNMLNVFMQNLDVLTMFRAYFREKAADLIRIADKKRVPDLRKYIKDKPSISANDIQCLPSLIKTQLIKEIELSRHYLPNDPKGRYLTNAEYKCVTWLVKGKSAEEISVILDRSQRTIEVTIEQIKNKFDCSKVSHLVYILVTYGLTI